MTLSGQFIVTVDPSVLGFEGMIHRFEVTAIGTYVHGIRDITKEHCSFIAWSFLAYRVVTDNGRFVRGGNGAFIPENCLLAC